MSDIKTEDEWSAYFERMHEEQHDYEVIDDASWLLAERDDAISEKGDRIRALETTVEKARLVIAALCEVLEEYSCDSHAMLCGAHGDLQIDWGDEEDEDHERRLIDYALDLRESPHE